MFRIGKSIDSILLVSRGRGGGGILIMAEDSRVSFMGNTILIMQMNAQIHILSR